MEMLPVRNAPGLMEEGELRPILLQWHGEAVYVPLLYQLYSIKYGGRVLEQIQDANLVFGAPAAPV